MDNSQSIPPGSENVLPPAARLGAGFTLRTGTRAVEPLSPWLPVLAGFVVAELTAYLTCQLPAPHVRTLVPLLLRAIRYVVVTVTAGAVGTYLPQIVLRRKPQIPARLLVRMVGFGWVFFPCIALLRRQYSAWIILVIGLASIPIALSLNLLAEALAEPAQAADRRRPVGDVLPSLKGLPGAEFNPWGTLLLGLCAQSAIVAVIANSVLLASVLVSASVFLAVARWSSLTTRVRRAKAGWMRARQAAFAVFLTFLSMVLWTSGAGQEHSPIGGMAHKPPPPHGDLIGNTSAGWVGIILLPPPVKKEEIVVPPDESRSLIAGLAKPIVIPFDGPYWYFKAPNRQPGDGAHVAHGKSTEVNVRSSNNAPLLMEARQDLGRPISLRCCRAIDISVTNADTRPGEVSLGLLLSDSKSPGAPSLYLGERPILSSEGDAIPPARPPVEETLHFLIPASPKLLRFDTLSVSFLPEKTRAHGGVKVAIEHFVLLPR